MKYVYYILAITLLVTACSKDKGDGKFQAEGVYTLESSAKAESGTVYLRLESDRAIRYTVQSQNNSYYWESLKYLDGKLNGKLILEDATCLSTNKDKLGKVVEDLSDNQFRITANGFFLDGAFFRKLSSNEVDRLLIQLENSSYECDTEGKAIVREQTLEEVVKASTQYLDPDSLKKDQLPFITGQVLTTNVEGQVQFILYSEKSYISYKFDENDNTVSWTYSELLDGTLTGRRAKLQNSCPANHPSQAQLVKLNRGGYSGAITPKNKHELKTDETDSNVIWIGSVKYQKVNTEEWQKFAEKMLKARVICQ